MRIKSCKTVAKISTPTKNVWNSRKKYTKCRTIKIIRRQDIVACIEFGFGKRFNINKSNEQASILLNWPASQIPREIREEVYDVKTEIFYVGYLVKNLIEKYDIASFKYSIILEQMVLINPDNRIESFELIQKEIAEQTFENIEFTHFEKTVYQNFATDFCNLLCKIKDDLVVERDSAVIIEKLRIILRDNSLEEYISQQNSLLSCFIKSGYTYYKNEILVEVVKNFYDFFVKQPSVLKEVVLNNLYGRISNIPVIDSSYGELPFS